MSKNKISRQRLNRLDKMKRSFELIRREKRSKCKKCGYTEFLIFKVPTNNSYGVYCAKCGTWVKFESHKNIEGC